MTRLLPAEPVPESGLHGAEPQRYNPTTSNALERC
jgi:hypothetical protein